MILPFVAISIIKIISNFDGKWCQEESDIISEALSKTGTSYIKRRLTACVKDWQTIHSVANYGVFEDNNTELWLMMIFIVLYCVFLAFNYQSVMYVLESVDRFSDTPSDYTLYVKGLPKDEDPEHIKYNMEVNGTLGTIDCEVKKISMVYDCSTYEKHLKKVDEVKTKLAIAEYKAVNDPSGNSTKTLQELRDKYSHEKDELKKIKSEILNNPEKHGIGACFITFATKEQADTVDKYWARHGSIKSLLGSLSSGYNRKYYVSVRGNRRTKIKLDMVRAQDPTGINWGNLGISRSEAATRLMISLALTILVLGVSFGGILGLKYLQYHMSKKNNIKKWLFQLVSIAISLLITGINFVLNLVITELTEIERQETKSSYYASLTVKLIVSQFINTCILPILVQIIVFGKAAIWIKGGVLPDALFILISQAFVTPIITALNFSALWGMFKRAYCRRKFRNGTPVYKTQKQLQEVFELPEFDPSAVYATFCTLILSSFFYQPILPMSFPLAIVGLFTTFVSVKFKLVYLSKISATVGEALISSAVFGLNLAPLAYGVDFILTLGRCVYLPKNVR